MKSKYIVITGASSGIGREAARLFAERGKNLILVARRKERLERLKKEIMDAHPNVDAVAIPWDLSCVELIPEFYNRLKPYSLEALINNAGIGDYSKVAGGDYGKFEKLLYLNAASVVLLSKLFTQDYENEPGAQLINVSSCGGYVIVPNAVTYCASKHLVCAFTEGLAWELKEGGSALRAKVFAPAATETEFGALANDAKEYSYSLNFPRYHTAREAALLLLRLYDSARTVGLVDRESFEFRLTGPLLPYAGGSASNQRGLAIEG